MNRLFDEKIFYPFFDFSYGFIQDCSEKMKYKVCSICFFGISLIFIINGADYFYVPLSIRSLIGYILLGIIMVFSYNPIKRGDDNYSSVLLRIYYVFVGVLFLLSIINAIDYLPTAFFLFVVLPVYMKIMRSNGNYLRMFDELANGFCFGFLLVLVISILGFPFNQLQYSGLFENPNNLGQFCIANLPLSLYKVERGKKKGEQLIWLALSGCVVSFCLFTESRTAIFGAILQLFLWIIFVFRIKQDVIKSMIHISKFVIVSIACLYTLIWMINNFSDCLKLNEKRVYINAPKYYQEMYETKVVETVSSLSYKILQRMAIGNIHLPSSDTTENTASNKQTTKEFIGKIQKVQEDMSVSSYSTKRTDYWKAFGENLNLIGHRSDEAIYIKKDNIYSRNAHNTFLQLGFENGIITMILYTVFWITLGITVLCQFFRKDYLELKMLLTMICVVYSFVSLVTALVVVFAYEMAFLFWIGTIPFLNNSSRNMQM